MRAVIVSCYPTNNLSNSLLSLTLESWSQQGHDLCLTSHHPINPDIQSRVKYFIYSDENEPLTFPEPSYLTWFMETDILMYKTNWGNKMGTHSYAILQNLKNGLELLKLKGYTDFIFIDDDTFLTHDEQMLFNGNLEKMSNLDSWFFIEWQEGGTTLLVSTLFGGKIDYFLNKINTTNSPQDYLDICASTKGYSLENYLGKVFYTLGNNYFEHKQLRQIFKNEWLGASNSNTVHVPGLKKILFWVDLVRDKNDPTKIYVVTAPNVDEVDINLKVYKNNKKVEDTNIKIGNFLRYWLYYDNEENDVWKVESWINNRLHKSIEMSYKEIIKNTPSYIELKN